MKLKRHELKKIYNHFVDHYNNKVVISFEEELAFSKACNFDTELMHSMCIIFYAGYRARMNENNS